MTGIQITVAVANELWRVLYVDEYPGILTDGPLLEKIRLDNAMIQWAYSREVETIVELNKSCGAMMEKGGASWLKRFGNEVNISVLQFAWKFFF